MAQVLRVPCKGTNIITINEALWRDTIFCRYIKSSLEAVFLSALLLLVCTWRHGGHVASQEQKHFSPLGTKLHLHVNSARKNSVALTPYMAALSRGCKPRIPCLKRFFYFRYMPPRIQAPPVISRPKTPSLIYKPRVCKRKLTVSGQCIYLQIWHFASSWGSLFRLHRTHLHTPVALPSRIHVQTVLGGKSKLYS